MNDAPRRNACPSLNAPMQTGDGLLVRLQMTAPCDLRGFARLCDSAAQHGNGIVEVTGRGSLQYRGFSVPSAAAFAEAVPHFGLPVRDGIAIETPPFSAPQTRHLADRIADFLTQISTAENAKKRVLAAKFAILLNDGSTGSAVDVTADIRLDAMPDGNWRIALGGTAGGAKPVDVLAVADVPERVHALCREIAALGPYARGRDLADITTRIDTPPLQDAPSIPVGLFQAPCEDGFHALALRLSTTSQHADTLAVLCRHAAVLGCRDIRFGAGRTIYLTGDRDACYKALLKAENLGFITQTGDLRLAISACAGQPACASARYATKELSERIVRQAPFLLRDGSARLHLSGCAKRCGCRDEKGLVLAGAAGKHHLFFGETELARLETDAVPGAITALDALVSSEKRASETTRTTMTRLGASRLMTAFERD